MLYLVSSTMAAQHNDFNLIPTSQFESSLAGRLLRWLLTSFRFLVIFVEIIVITGFVARFWLDMQHSQLDDEITQAQELLTAYLPFEKDFRHTQKQLETLKNTNDQANKLSQLLTIITQSLPNDATLISFNQSTGVIEITATAIEEKSISQFLVNLRSRPETAQVTTTRVATDSKTKALEFTLKQMATSAISKI
ncbi:hypothetical protein A2382_04905 [Candidatus Woesebacteria bacterium RIFOXYB1_FULL_38_16]|uniref:Fimbrial assembly protein n=1 Tax=Candidatus Woesebacteria bacterium RIFOXYB1_FULL_38_16 TaxID=1802538 RepID=A0A1F8CUJ5_9BACT|nr:MAG: hypothetical protein A2191_00255 [Candidatus Woesebacteria bacterium RIFOXYA1_FULL_38_9]OGM79997.1 MAG: hypothetical protein A2382_04905 [Candidatus Woesebacteria bacterium RIFOXYB1_FULL_38_16]